MSEFKDKDLAKVKELIEIMKENDLVEIEIADGDSKIHLKRPQAQMQAVQAVQQIPMPQAVVPAAGGPEATAADSSLNEITSPMVGTFYSSPSPDSDPYVKVGDRISEGTVVCIIEAMKVMNELKAETSGTLVEILCQAGQAVEFGEALFRVKPD